MPASGREKPGPRPSVTDGESGMSQKNILLDANSNELELIEFYIDEVQSDGSS